MNAPTMGRDLARVALFVAMLTAVRPAMALPIVELVLTPQGGGVYRYDLTVDNTAGPEDLSLVNLNDAPVNDPLIPLTLVAPAGFGILYDPDLGFGFGVVTGYEDSSFFAVGTVVSGFSFQSAADPSLFFTRFDALSVNGTTFEGDIRRTILQTPGVPDAGSTGFILSFGLLGLSVIRRNLVPLLQGI